MLGVAGPACWNKPLLLRRGRPGGVSTRTSPSPGPNAVDPRIPAGRSGGHKARPYSKWLSVDVGAGERGDYVVRRMPARIFPLE